jgi:methionine-rich copper-binding protein CopC
MDGFFKWAVVAAMIVPALGAARPALADLVSSSPEANSSVDLRSARIVSQIDLRFAEEIDVKSSRFSVLGPKGRLFTTIGQDNNNKSVIFISLWSSILPGRYIVQWQTASPGKKPDHGSLVFTVKP